MAGDASFHVRAAAAAALGDAAALKALAGDRSPWVRGQTGVSLAKLSGDGFADALPGYSGDPSWWVRSQAMAAAAELPSRGDAILLKGLADEDTRVRSAALEALGRRASTAAVEAVAAVLLDAKSSLEMRGTAVDAVPDLKSPALLRPLEAAYRASMAREFVEVREDVVDAAAALSSGSAEAGMFLSSLLDDPAPSVRLKAARALKQPVGLETAGSVSPFVGKAWSGGTLLALSTTKGLIVIALSTASAPGHCLSAASLARQGVYDGTQWHRLATNFVVQGGDPRGSGWGDAGYFLRDEIGREKFSRGTVGMPKAGKDTGGCQIFIATVPAPHLDGRYTAFGRVVEGMEVVDSIEPGDRILKAEVR
jgi:cyclophilin family peptidyl-prolyl cis-trans isomerase